MAVWGAPTAREDDAERAVRAALELVDAVRSLGPQVSARAGVLTGEAAVTLGATNQGMVAGDLVNTASRLQSVAAPGTVLVGEATQRAARQAIAFEPAGEQTLKGKAAPVEAWRALRVVAEVGGRNRSESLEAPFVGRDEELRLLKDLFHATGRERRIRLISVTGPAGIGKSRLAWEFLKYVDGLARDRLVACRSQPCLRRRDQLLGARRDGPRPCRPGRDRRRGDDPSQGRRHRGRVDPGRGRAALGRVGAPDPARPRDRRRARTSCSPRGGRSSSGSPPVAPWRWSSRTSTLADSGPARLHRPPADLEQGPADLHRHAGPPRAPREAARLGRRASATSSSLSLEPLRGPGDAASCSPDSCPACPTETVRAIVARADGIPLYAVETVRMLLAEGRLAIRDGVYVPVGDLTGHRRPGDAHGADRGPARCPRPGRPDAGPGCERSSARASRSPALAAVSGMDPARARATPRGARPARAADPRGGRRDRLNGVSTPSSRRSSGRSPTTRWPRRTARPGISRPPGSSRRSGPTSSSAPWRAITWPPRPTRPKVRKPTRSPARPGSLCAPRPSEQRPSARSTRPSGSTSRRSRSLSTPTTRPTSSSGPGIPRLRRRATTRREALLRRALAIRDWRGGSQGDRSR